MATGTTTSASSISDISDYCVFAEVRFGGNGSGEGETEYEVGGSGVNNASARIVWDSNTSDGVDSGAIAVELTASAGGGTNGVSWVVTGGTVVPLNFSGVTYGAIEKVRIRAAVQMTAQMQWGSVSVKFYRNGRLTESYTQASGPEVDTRSSPSSATAEQVLEVTPQFTTNTKVVVSGTVRLVAAQGVFPGPNDVFGQIFVKAASCAAA